MHSKIVVGLLLAAAASTSAQAYEFRCRFVERVGSTDVVLLDNSIVNDGFVHNVRLQFGVFDDAAGAAPAGGFVGWNVGTLTVSRPLSVAEHRRNPGRLFPFNFAPSPNANGNPPLPGGDPFMALTDIDATLGTQSPAWRCNADGTPAPQPMPVSRGLNTFVSVYAFSTQSINGQAFTVTATGNLIAAAEWRTVGNPAEPDCGDPSDPSDDIPGSVTYAPFVVQPQAFSCVFTGRVTPGPGAASLIGVGMVMGAVRRRRGARGS